MGPGMRTKAVRGNYAFAPQLCDIAMRGSLLHSSRLVEKTVNRGNVFEELTAKLSELIASSPARDLEKNARALLSSFLSRLDLVTREEFDVQAEVLRRTREKLDQLEGKVAELENQRTSRAVDE